VHAAALILCETVSATVIRVITRCVFSVQIPVPGCVEVRASDRVGFTTFEGPSPIASRFDVDLFSSETGVRIAPASAPFDAMTLPYDFAVAAAYLPNSSC